MSFFGITALGPPNTFSANLVNALGLNVFSDEEFESTFRRVDKDGSGTITPDEVEDLLTETYGFPPLEEEVKMFMEEFDLNQDGRVTMEEFKCALTRMREKMNKKAEAGREYTSALQMREDRFKHKRVQGEVTAKYKLPMTSAQRNGFYNNDEQQRDIAKMTTYPVRKCQETKYADEMVRTGFLFN